MADHILHQVHTINHLQVLLAIPLRKQFLKLKFLPQKLLSLSFCKMTEGLDFVAEYGDVIILPSLLLLLSYSHQYSFCLTAPSFEYVKSCQMKFRPKIPSLVHFPKVLHNTHCCFQNFGPFHHASLLKRGDTELITFYSAFLISLPLIFGFHIFKKINKFWIYFGENFLVLEHLTAQILLIHFF